MGQSIEICLMNNCFLVGSDVYMQGDLGREKVHDESKFISLHDANLNTVKYGWYIMERIAK